LTEEPIAVIILNVMPLSEYEARAQLLEAIPQRYHNILGYYEAAVAQINAQKRGAAFTDSVSLGDDIERRLARLVRAIGCVEVIPHGTHILASSPEEIQATRRAYCYTPGLLGEEIPEMKMAEVVGIRKFLLTGETIWRVKLWRSRREADPSWKLDPQITRRVADGVVEKYLPRQIATTILAAGNS
jgi:hypothetical protein